ncbi:MAG: hypothetical protein OEV34_09170 [Gammaproteobacteria bacterium]|nr:hypothetical protein [Gammaproteobacteria bacterium]
MKIPLITIALAAMFAAVPALAEKPEWAGKGKPGAEQKADHKDAMNAKGGKRNEIEEDKNKKYKVDKNKEEKFRKEKGEYERDGERKTEKHKAEKTEREQKELGKGSEEGQESRETRKKWWNLWGE